MKYTVIIEKGESSFGAYAPDFPGCIAVGETEEEALSLIKEALEFHLEGLKEEGKAIPDPQCSSAVVEIGDGASFQV